MKMSDTIKRELDYTKDSSLNYYTVHIYCGNCEKHDEVYVKKGVRKAGLSVKCENCNCTVKL